MICTDVLCPLCGHTRHAFSGHFANSAEKHSAQFFQGVQGSLPFRKHGHIPHTGATQHTGLPGMAHKALQCRLNCGTGCRLLCTLHKSKNITCFGSGSGESVFSWTNSCPKLLFWAWVPPLVHVFGPSKTF